MLSWLHAWCMSLAGCGFAQMSTALAWSPLPMAMSFLSTGWESLTPRVTFRIRLWAATACVVAILHRECGLTSGVRCAHACPRTHPRTRAHAHARTHAHAHTRTRTCTCTHIRTQAHTQHMHIHAQTHAHTHTARTHTHIHV